MIWLDEQTPKIIRAKNNCRLQWQDTEMEAFSALLALCAGNSPGTGEFPSQMPVMPSFKFSLIYAWTNGWVNNRNAGNVRRFALIMTLL